MSTENLNNAAKLYQATVMLLSGRADKPVDVLFFHNHAYGDYTGLFEIAGETFHKGRTRFVAVTNNEGERFGSIVPFEANPGKTECIRRLTEEQRIPITSILLPETQAFHTRGENDTFLELSQQNNWLTGLILTQPHRLLRAMLGMLQAMEQGGYMMAIYTAAPNYTPWQEVAYGNQSIKSQPRFQNIAEELERVYQYLASGELASFDQLSAYLKARDDSSLILGSVEKGSERLTRDLPNYQTGSI